MIVKYSKKFPYAPYLNEDIGFEMEIGDGVLPPIIQESLKFLKEMAEKFHKDNNPQLTEYRPNFFDTTSEVINGKTNPLYQPPQPLQSIDRKAIERKEILTDKINEVKTVEDLEPLYFDAVDNQLMLIYETKFNQLKNI